MRRRRVVTALAVAVAVGASGTAGAAGAGAAPPASPTAVVGPVDATGLVAALLRVRTPASGSSARDGQVRLAHAVEDLRAALGVPMRADVTAAVRTLPAGAAALLADVLGTALVCRQATAAALPEGVPLLADGRLVPVSAAAQQQVRACVAPLDAAVRAATLRLPAELGSGKDIDLWPVLRVARGNRDDVHRHDYAVLVDEGGDDLHLGAAGSNMLDLQRPPWQTSAARGCEQVFPDATTGRVRRGPDGTRRIAPTSEWRPECVAAVGVLIDLAGDDRYGELEEPGFPDDRCTRDRVVRRMSTQGVGVAGVGILHDADGRDRYTGKTLTQGAGHLGGVGLLRDEGGDDDRYLAIRTAQGAAVLGGIGLLVDDGGNDDHDFYLPRPLDPQAPPQAEGSGGVNDDTGLGSEVWGGNHRDENGRRSGQPGGSCDGIARSVQGVGLLGGIGLLVDAAGDDRYRAAPRTEQEFLRPLDGPAAVRFAHGSQGSGLFGGTGVLWDGGGRDRYLEGRRPSATRRDGAMLLPAVHPSQDATTGGSIEVRAFVDR